VNRVEAVILDWAGTTVDYGSLAPLKAVTELFVRRGLPLTDAEARRDMGIFKKDHIRNILSMGRVRAEWDKLTGKLPSEEDVEALFAEFIPLQFEVLEAHSGLIAGVQGLAHYLRSCGIKLGSTTGYTRPMLDVLLTAAKNQGYTPDLSYCPDDVGGGRPYPWMCLRIAMEFRLSSVSAAVKAGDTVSDIHEATNAGMWAVGIAATGNEIGLDAEGLAALSEQERTRRIEAARARLNQAGAHFVVDDASRLAPVLDEIDDRLKAGERP
jgi:phosphonoacetaldehyde hydrolase